MERKKRETPKINSGDMEKIASPKAQLIHRLADTRVEIVENPGIIDDAAFFHIAMCQVALPRSKKAIEGKRVFERTSGTSSILVEAGKLWDGKKWQEQPLPYGANPRLVLAWLNTYAKRYNVQEIPIGDSAREFLSILGKDVSGGVNGTWTRLKQDLLSLMACHLTLGYMRAGHAITFKGDPFEKIDAWSGQTLERQTDLWPRTIKFSYDYFKALTDGRMAIPIDMRALTALKGSALAMDIYLMLAERLHRVKGQAQLVRWKSLREQFGQEYVDEKNFKKQFITSFTQVQVVYPKCKARIIDGGVNLVASPPPIEKPD